MNENQCQDARTLPPYRSATISPKFIRQQGHLGDGQGLAADRRGEGPGGHGPVDRGRVITGSEQAITQRLAALSEDRLNQGAEGRLVGDRGEGLRAWVEAQHHRFRPWVAG